MELHNETLSATSDNTALINGVVKSFLIFSLVSPSLLALGVFLGVFVIPFKFLIILQVVISIISIPPLVLILRKKFPHFTKYYGMLSCAALVGFVGSSGYVGLYMSYGLFPLLSTLYYDKKFTYRITLICYVIMVVSMILRVNFSHAVRLSTGAVLSKSEYFFTYISGFTIEYVLLSFIAKSMVKRGERQLNKIYSLLDDKEKLLEDNGSLLEEATQKNVSYALKIDELHDTQLKIIGFLGQILGSHDMFTGNHVLHTQVYVSIISKKLYEKKLYPEELTSKFISQMETGALLHDIGKIHIPEGILNMDGKYSDEEYQFMKSHPQEGKKLLEYLPMIDGGHLNQVAIDMAYCHHEKWDGSGYPQGIKGTNIPLSARIMAAADVFDALVSRRIYKEPVSVDEALEIFKKSSGSHFEPAIVEAVLECRNELEEADKKFKIQESIQNQTEMEWWARYREYNKTRNKQKL